MREGEFLRYLNSRGLAEKTIEMTMYALKRIERAYGVDLDEEFGRDRLSSLMDSFIYSRDDERAGRPNPSKMEIEPGREYKALAWYRHKIRLYEAFCLGTTVSAAEVESEEADDDIGRTFGLERDLQAALRANIQQLEAGLKVVDGGVEKKVEAGLIDILAKDKAGNWVVIELKADVARPAAATQVLAYMSCIAAENSGEVRGILIASDFDKKITLAARSIPSLQLKRYRFNFEFE